MNTTNVNQYYELQWYIVISKRRGIKAD